ncbi:thiamine pyrophosphate-binding protein [Gordonia sp. NPDC003424]
MTEIQSVAHYLMRVLREHGVRVTFGVHGANIEDLYAAAPACGVTAVVAKHEFAAGAMADGSARITGHVGVVTTTSGGGAMNVIPALAEAFDSRVPVLAIIGSAPTPLVGNGAFQDMLNPPDTIDLMSLLASVTGSCSLVSSTDSIDAALDTAFATLDRGLPAALVIPKDVQAAPMPRATSVHHHRRGRHHDADPDTDRRLERLADRLAAVATSPGDVCLWVGEEASTCLLGREVDDLATLLGASVVASPGGRDVVADCAGITGVMGHPSAHSAVRTARVVLAVGTRLSVTDRAGLDEALRGKEVTVVGSHRPRVDGCVTIGVGDLAESMRLLCKLVDARIVRSPARPVITVEYLPTPSRASGMPDLRSVVETIGRHLPRDCAVFADAGNAGAGALHHLPFAPSQRFVVALGMGGMGYAIAAGVGNAVRSSLTGESARTIVIAGDGAFFMHGMEIHTAVEHAADVTLIVLNNDAHGMCVTRDHLYFPDSQTVNRFKPSAIAEGLDAMFADLDVRHPRTADELDAQCAELFTATGPNALVIDVDPDEVPPFAPFLPKG